MSSTGAPSYRDTVFGRFRLDGLTALVTGAGPGLGFAVARAFAAAGAAVALCARSQDKVDRVVRTIENDDGSALGAVADVGRADDLERFTGVARDQLGRGRRSGLAPRLTREQLHDRHDDLRRWRPGQRGVVIVQEQPLTSSVPRSR